MVDLDTATEAASAIARDAGALLLSKFRSVLDVQYKGTPTNIVTDVDLASEALITSSLRERFPDHAILAEEHGAYTGDADALWIIDPLDGTNNYAHGYPRFCVSMALAIKGEVLLGVIFDPIADELYLGTRGHGATVNGTPLAVSSATELIRALCCTGFPYDKATSKINNLAQFVALLPKVQGVRRDGAAALDLCYVARGVFDAYWELKLKAWDVAAGALIVEEAGGRVSDLHGGALDIYGAEILAPNGHLHTAMVETLSNPTPQPPTASSDNT